MAIQYLQTLVKQVSDAIPPSVEPLKQEFLAAFQERLSATLEKLDLVTRQEFDIQTALLKTTADQLKVLEEKIAHLEKSFLS